MQPHDEGQFDKNLRVCDLMYDDKKAWNEYEVKEAGECSPCRLGLENSSI